MIKINLLIPYKELNKSGGVSTEGVSDENKVLLKEALKRIVVFAIGPICLIVYESNNIPKLETKLRQTDAKLQEYKQFNDSKQNLAQEIKKYEDIQSRFNAQMDFINQIDKDKVSEYRLLSLIKNSTPEKVWINKLSVVGNNLSISAESSDVKELEKFMAKMTESDFITQVKPTTQTDKKDFAGTGIQTTVFEITAVLVSAKGRQ